MAELRLLFEKTSDKNGHTIQIVLGPDEKSEPVPFTFSLTDDDHEDLRWYLEDYMDLPDGGAIVRAQRIERSLETWGRALFDAVFTPALHEQYRAQLKPNNGPHTLTIATDDTAILRLPWEIMADTAGALCFQALTIRRQLSDIAETEAPETHLPLRILLVVSRPADQGFIDPRLTSAALLEALKPLGDNVTVDFCRPPCLARLEEMLLAARNAPYHIVHFDGHGTFLPEIELGALCFEQADDRAEHGEVQTDYVRADRFGKILTAHRVPLVILEACRSGQIGTVAMFRTVAPRLIKAGVGSVISMSHAVHIEAAQLFLESFYRDMVTGASVGQAVEQGRAVLIKRPARWLELGPGAKTVELQDWFLPNLYQRGHDQPILPPAPPPPDKFDVFLSHNSADKPRIERLALLLKNRHGLRVWFDKWEMKLGFLSDHCVEGVQKSRVTLIACTQAALDSKWVAKEKNWAFAIDPDQKNVLPLLMEDVELPPDLQALTRLDFTDPAQDADQVAEIARLVGPPLDGDAQRRDARVPAQANETGAFPHAPRYGFQGRARELYDLERYLRTHRAVLLHAMGGMGKTTLATEAAHWWTRTGLFPDGAVFISFEQFTSADRVVQVLGEYLEGVAFNALPAEDQYSKAKELFAQKRVLMVWDNFESVLPAFQAGQGPNLSSLYNDEERAHLVDLFDTWTQDDTGQGRLLITCRPEDTGLPRARKTELTGLARPDSLWLLVRVLETAGVDLDDPRLGRDKLEQLLDLLADHPLSVELVGPHLKNLTPEEICRDFSQLLEGFKTGAGTERNESLLASLAFSTQRLSEAAQAALPWLGLFTGGVFEQVLLDISEMPAEQWAPVRAELEATALVRAERTILLGGDEKNGRPFLRFHPTLGYAAVGRTVPDPDKTRERFIGVYGAVDTAVAKALHGPNPRWGLEILSREEANVRLAVRWAAEDKQYATASALGNTFGTYLQMSGRLRERDAWVTWLAAELRKGGFSEALASGERDEAWTLFTQGQPEEAIAGLQDLIARLQATTEFDPAFQLATTQAMLGRVFNHCGQSERAIPVLEQAVGQWETLVQKAGGESWEALMAKEQHKEAETELGNLAATLGDLANALGSAGRLDEALSISEQGLEIRRALGNDREVAAGEGRCAGILMDQGRSAEADARYDAALNAARRAGDRELEGSLLQHQGILAYQQEQYTRATKLYQQALKLFQEMNDEPSIMRTCNLQGVAEQNQNRLSEARTWYERSREIALRLGAVVELAQAAQNIGIVCQEEGQAARAQGRKPEARRCFEEARQSIQEAVGLMRQLKNEPDEAATLSQLAQVLLLLGDLDEAERHAHQAREIRERLGLKEVFRTYHTLADIARARGDEAQAAEWQRKRDAVLEEQKRRAAGPGDGLPPQFMEAIQGLAMACAKAAVEGTDLDPDVEAALAQIDKPPAPLPELGAFLRRLAAGEFPAVPEALGDLPQEMRDLLTQILDAVKEERQG